MSSLAGLGKVGAWQVDLDNEPKGSSHVWCVTLIGPRFYLVTKLDSLDAMDELAAFLSEEARAGAEFRLPLSAGVMLVVVRDDGHTAFKVYHSDGVAESGVSWLVE